MTKVETCSECEQQAEINQCPVCKEWMCEECAEWTYGEDGLADSDEPIHACESCQFEIEQKERDAESL